VCAFVLNSSFFPYVYCFVCGLEKALFGVMWRGFLRGFNGPDRRFGAACARAYQARFD
jgi:hypothetical protein